MSKGTDYHTDSREYPLAERSVYHNHDACQIGGRIQPVHRKPGRGAGLLTRELCEECARLTARTDGSCATWF